MDRLLFYHDFVSPFCFLASRITAEAASRTGLSLRPVPFELFPAPAPLPEPDDLFGEELEVVRGVAVEWGLENMAMRPPPRVPRTRKAHEAVTYARTQESDERVLKAIYDALWRDGRDISRLDVLAEVGAATGLDREGMHVALGLDDLAGEVVREQEAAASIDLAGVPAVQVGGVMAVGLLPLEELVEWIQSNR